MNTHHRIEFRETLTLAAICALLGCGSERPDALGAAWNGTQARSGDTVIVRTESGSVIGDLGTIDSSSVEIIYDGVGLQRTSPIVLTSQDAVIIGETDRIVRVSADGRIDSTGRAGDGPGEFRRIRGVVASGDSVSIVDAQLLRLTLVGDALDLRRTDVIARPKGFAELGLSVLAQCDSAYFMVWGPGMVAPGGPPDTLVLTGWQPGAETHVLERIEGVSWTRSPIPGPLHPYGVRALVATNGRCHVAIASGVKYGLTLRELNTRGVTSIVVSEEAPALTPEARELTSDVVETFPGPVRPGITALVQAQEFGPRRNKLEELRFDDAGRLWVRVVDSTYRHHPIAMLRSAETRPRFYRWDVFDLDGRRLAVVRLPSSFAPAAWSGAWVYGLLERDDGTFAVARLSLPARLAARGTSDAEQ